MRLKIQKFFTAAAAAAAVLLSVLPVRAAPATSARSAILMDAASGRILCAQNADAHAPIASTTKIMTGLLACESGRLSESVTVPDEAVGVEGSSMYLKRGETLRIGELLYGLMLHSGNDAAQALAIVLAGSEAEFCAQMNRRAAQLGLADTHFENPSGLDAEGHYSTARDLAVLTRAALENPDFLRVVSTRSIRAAGRSLTNHNKLLWRYEGCIGVKTGYTKRAGRVLVSAAQRDGRRLIAVTICDPDDWRDHAVLLDYGFSAFRTRQLVRAGAQLGTCAVLGGQEDSVRLLAEDDFSYPLLREEQVTFRLHAPQFTWAPVERTQAGSLEILLAGNPIGRVPVRFAREIAQTEKKGLWARIFGG